MIFLRAASSSWGFLRWLALFFSTLACLRVYLIVCGLTLTVGALLYTHLYTRKELYTNIHKLRGIKVAQVVIWAKGLASIPWGSEIPNATCPSSIF